MKYLNFRAKNGKNDFADFGAKIQTMIDGNCISKHESMQDLNFRAKNGKN